MLDVGTYLYTCRRFIQKHIRGVDGERDRANGRAVEARKRKRGGRGKGWKAESEAETRAPEPVYRHGYETGFYQIISCHTDDDAAQPSRADSGLSFPS